MSTLEMVFLVLGIVKLVIEIKDHLSKKGD